MCIILVLDQQEQAICRWWVMRYKLLFQDAEMQWNKTDKEVAINNI